MVVDSCVRAECVSEKKRKSGGYLKQTRQPGKITCGSANTMHKRTLREFSQKNYFRFSNLNFSFFFLAHATLTTMSLRPPRR